MGIFNRKEKAKDINQNIITNTNRYGAQFDLEFVNANGNDIKVKFAEIVTLGDKHLQKIYIDGLKKIEIGHAGSLIGDEYLMDPVGLSKNESGQIVSQTKECFTELQQSRIDALNIFFNPDEINHMETNYIGGLETYKNSYIRNTDRSFEAKYKSAIEEKRKMDISKMNERDDFAVELAKKNSEPYANSYDTYSINNSRAHNLKNFGEDNRNKSR